jgi:response regulator NasT
VRDDETSSEATTRSPTPADLAATMRAKPRPANSGDLRRRDGQQQESSAVQPAPADTRKRVVIAEDEALIRLDLKETLDELGYAVVGEAGDGERAVALAEELRPDLVILDVKMPVLDGISAARRIAAERIAPVVILTAFSQRDLVERARDAGAMAYLVKPFSSADLLPAIEMAMSRHAEVAALEAEVADLSERLETRKIIDRAKGLLQVRESLTEPEAFRWIQRAAMDQRVSMRAVAESVISGQPDDASSA